MRALLAEPFADGVHPQYALSSKSMRPLSRGIEENVQEIQTSLQIEDPQKVAIFLVQPNLKLGDKYAHTLDLHLTVVINL